MIGADKVIFKYCFVLPLLVVYNGTTLKNSSFFSEISGKVILEICDVDFVNLIVYVACKPIEYNILFTYVLECDTNMISHNLYRNSNPL